ncbi:zwei Ig domain protein zig-8 isoform X2 [Agrilus planipennis]|uniref:Zwei Ig domain protein zig-8 isoform X2 n=1 Tax=Agrilus planipennis TaxID=224129 RepID=A0A1W4WS02_AGRPL|nr:zwei Ig domain protein zig-8 isoform X2 [Agrilus planipennis]XP_018323273.1 zwei Ig domain protein zig-8 isoform X2 [Agrilus planipennis]
MVLQGFYTHFCPVSLTRITLVLLIAKATCSGHSDGAAMQHQTAPSSSVSSTSYSDFLKQPPQPKFDDLNIRSINARIAQTVLLPCTVWNAGDKVVSWIRKKDLLIISSGMFTFSGDNRFEPVYSPGRNFWGLRIRGVKESDTGQYECQVNTDPKMSLAINLTVSDRDHIVDDLKGDRRISIKGPGQLHVHSGSSVILTCEVSWTSQNHFKRKKRNNKKAKPVIKWFHNGFEISFETRRDGLSLENNSDELCATSRLRLASVKEQDVGQYTCSDGVSVPASVNLYVIEVDGCHMMVRSSQGLVSYTLLT